MCRLHRAAKQHSVRASRPSLCNTAAAAVVLSSSTWSCCPSVVVWFIRAAAMAASATTTTNGVLGEDSSRCPSPLWLLETGQQTQTQSDRQTVAALRQPRHREHQHSGIQRKKSTTTALPFSLSALLFGHSPCLTAADRHSFDQVGSRWCFQSETSCEL